MAGCFAQLLFANVVAVIASFLKDLVTRRFTKFGFGKGIGKQKVAIARLNKALPEQGIVSHSTSLPTSPE